MPAGTIGSVWESGSWPDTAWEAGSWADASASVDLDLCEATVISLMPIRESLSLMPDRSVESLMPHRTVERIC